MDIFKNLLILFDCFENMTFSSVSSSTYVDCYVHRLHWLELDILHTVHMDIFKLLGNNCVIVRVCYEFRLLTLTCYECQGFQTPGTGP